MYIQAALQMLVKLLHLEELWMLLCELIDLVHWWPCQCHLLPQLATAHQLVLALCCQANTSMEELSYNLSMQQYQQDMHKW